MNELSLFASTFGVVFFLGFQSLSVNSGHYWLAGINSLIIGAFNLALFKTAPHVTGWLQTCCYLFGGPLGILAAMWVHRNVVGPYMLEKAHSDHWKWLGETVKKHGWKRLS